MPDRRSTPDATDDADPRLENDYVRTLSGSGESGEVVLIGVVHDHPASVYRVGAVVDATAPDVLALELPPVAVPLFERYADDARSPPASGGEMSTAIQAATTDRLAGIDGPSIGFLSGLARSLHRDGASVRTMRRVFRNLRSVTRRAVACRLAAVVVGRTRLEIAIRSSVDHDCRSSDDPGSQAADEREQVRRARAVATVFGRSDADRLQESAREGHMADRLSSLRREGVVAAVVGIDHLDPLAERLGGERAGAGE